MSIREIEPGDEVRQNHLGLNTGTEGIKREPPPGGQSQ
jgi:hypothetical protein